MKRYLRLSIIRKLPLFVVLSVLLLTVAFTSASNVDFESGDYYHHALPPESGVSGLIGTFIMITAMLKVTPSFLMLLKLLLCPLIKCDSSMTPWAIARY